MRGGEACVFVALLLRKHVNAQRPVLVSTSDSVTPCPAHNTNRGRTGASKAMTSILQITMHTVSQCPWTVQSLRGVRGLKGR